MKQSIASQFLIQLTKLLHVNLKWAEWLLGGADGIIFIYNALGWDNIYKFKFVIIL